MSDRPNLLSLVGSDGLLGYSVFIKRGLKRNEDFHDFGSVAFWSTAFNIFYVTHSGKYSPVYKAQVWVYEEVAVRMRWVVHNAK